MVAISVSLTCSKKKVRLEITGGFCGHRASERISILLGGGEWLFASDVHPIFAQSADGEQVLLFKVGWLRGHLKSTTVRHGT